METVAEQAAGEETGSVEPGCSHQAALTVKEAQKREATG